MSGAVDDALGVTHHFVGGYYAKAATIPQGALLGQHVHAYDHDSVLAIGEALLYATPLGEAVRVTHHVAPSILKIKAGVDHKVLALTDCLWLCVHRTDETDPDKVDAVLIEKEG